MISVHLAEHFLSTRNQKLHLFRQFLANFSLLISFRVGAVLL